MWEFTASKPDRLDRSLRDQKFMGSEWLSRLAWEWLITHGKVEVNQRKAVKAGENLLTGDRVRVEFPGLLGLQSEGPPARLVWISPDRTWAIFDKPPQLDSVSLFPWDQNSFANRVLAFACQEGLSFGELSQAPSMEGGLLQRLDRDTSGLVCAAFNKEAKARFRTDFSTGAIEKEYLALVTVPLNSGSHSLWFEEAHGAKVRASLEPRRQGEEVKLSLEILNTSARGSLVSIKTRQGRRHVVRAGLATLGAPLLGDKTYGGSDSEPFHQLHAFRLSFPFSPRIMEVNPPQSFLDASARLGLDYSG